MKLTKLVNALVENDRGILIFCIKEYGENFSENQLWSLSLEPKLLLRQRIKTYIQAELDLLRNFSESTRN